MIQQIPTELLASLQTVKGFDEDAFRLVHESGEQITSVRLNSKKILDIQHSTLPTGRQVFNDQLDQVPWNASGYYLPSRPSFTTDPLFHAGAYYVQEASSMFLEEAIKQTCDLTKPIRVLDLCAAPGGKSTLIQSIISENSLLVCNEIIKTRVNILTENMTKWGGINVVVTNNEPKDFQRLSEYFDLIVVDAPCSGSGLFRKDPDAIDEWSLNNVTLCCQRQQRILSDILPALKPGGVLIYSTCSYSTVEDEDICDWLLSGIPVRTVFNRSGSIQHPHPSGIQPGEQYPLSNIRLQTKTEWNIIETVSNNHNAFGYRFYPDKLKGEGFFIAAFKKTGIETDENRTKSNNKLSLISKAEIDDIRPYFKSIEGISFFKWQEEIISFPTKMLNDLSLLQSSLYIKKAGIKTGAIIRNELIPDHELAMCNLVAESVPSIHVDKETALRYLRRQEISIDTLLKGWVLIKFQQTSLGWIKILSNRINNYYPKSWRILNK